MGKEKDNVLDTILAPKPSTNDLISKMVESQEDTFPDASEVEVSYQYRDPYEIPAWCNQEDYAFAWVDITDDIAKYQAFEVGHFRLVKRISPCVIQDKLNQRDFRDHGAVQRRMDFLLYRPKALDDKLRTYPILRHVEIARSLQEGKSGQGYEISQRKGEDSGSKIEVVAAEEAGTEGIKTV